MRKSDSLSITHTVEIFWTGGYDSTFRILQLSMKPVIIQPYYCSDNRKSEKNELTAMAVITKLLSERPTTRAIMKPLIVISATDRIVNEHISSTWMRVRENDFFGTQYDWLARFATAHPGIELSVHKDDKAILLIEKYGKLKLMEDDMAGSYYILDQENSSDDMNTLFGNYRFPLAEYTKEQMKEEYMRENARNIMEETWFCYTPIHGKPCGKCNPCIYSIEEGMRERFSKEALVRYRLKKWKNALKGRSWKESEKK
jgi:7-cyano-7-deazaguanine synthase